MERLAYLGPPGSFAHQAVLTLPSTATDLQPAASVAAALQAVRNAEVAAALVPFESSIEGSVAATLDGLGDPARSPLQITREVLLDVHFAVVARPGTALGSVRTVATHPHAEAQCRGWLSAHLPAAEVVLTASTSTAARDTADGRYDAAVASPVAAPAYRLVVLADDVADTPGGVTRFVLCGRPSPLGSPTGADRTTVVLYERDDHPGALLEMLSAFAVRGVNLTRLESRPTGAGLGSYCFCLDVDGHLADARVGEALAALRRVCAQVRFCGSYPRAVAPTGAAAGRRDQPSVDPDAAQWLDRLRRGDPA